MKTCSFFVIVLCYQSGMTMGNPSQLARTGRHAQPEQETPTVPKGDMKLSIDATGDSKVELQYVGGVRSTKGRTTTAGGGKLSIATADPLAKAPMARTPKARLSAEVHGDGSFTQAPNAQQHKKHVASAEVLELTQTPTVVWTLGTKASASPAFRSCDDACGNAGMNCYVDDSFIMGMSDQDMTNAVAAAGGSCSAVVTTTAAHGPFLDGACFRKTNSGFDCSLTSSLGGNGQRLCPCIDLTPAGMVWQLGTTASASPALRNCNDVCANTGKVCYDGDALMLGLSGNAMANAVTAAGGTCSAVVNGGQPEAPLVDGNCFTMSASQTNFDCAVNALGGNAKRLCPCV